MTSLGRAGLGLRGIVVAIVVIFLILVLFLPYDHTALVFLLLLLLLTSTSPSPSSPDGTVVVIIITIVVIVMGLRATQTSMWSGFLLRGWLPGPPSPAQGPLLDGPGLRLIHRTPAALGINLVVLCLLLILIFILTGSLSCRNGRETFAGLTWKSSVVGSGLLLLSGSGAAGLRLRGL